MNCLVDGCTNPPYRRGWCNAHYMRWKRHGDPLGGGPIRNRNPETCIEKDCNTAAIARGWCGMHWQRWRKHNDPTFDQPQRGENGARWAGNAVGYHGMHIRIKDTRGNASDHLCVDCGQPAAEWSYIGGDPNERFDPKIECNYSVDPTYYVPRCRRCHRKADASAYPVGEAHHSSKLTETDVLTIRTAAAKGRSQRDIARQFNVYQTTVSDIIRRKTWRHI